MAAGVGAVANDERVAMHGFGGALEYTVEFGGGANVVFLTERQAFRKRWLSGHRRGWHLCCAERPASGGEFDSAFATPRLNNGAPATGFHTRAKAVRALALDVAGLECSFHSNIVVVCRVAELRRAARSP